jgi:hypothetical protein
MTFTAAGTYVLRLIASDTQFFIDFCINNAIIEALCSPPKQQCPDPKEVLISWKIGAGELWPYWIPVVRSTKWDGVLDAMLVQ